MPLHLSSSLLSLSDQSELTKLILSPAFKTLKKVVECKALEKEVESVNAIAKSTQFDKYSDAALREQKSAAVYRDCFNVLLEVELSSTHNVVNTITTTPV
jgi:hypothetical protein